MAKQINTIIFDLDGTLLNTLLDLTNSVNVMLDHFNLEHKTLDFVRLAIGNGVKVLCRRCLPSSISEEQYQEGLEIFRKHYLIHSNDHTSPYPEVNELCLKLKEQGYKLAVATNKLDEAAKELIEIHFPNIFDCVQGTTETIKAKPANDIINSICSLLHIEDKDRVLYIGDTAVDYQTAKNANITPVIVTYGYRNKKELKNDIKKEDYDTISSPLELLTYLAIKS